MRSALLSQLPVAWLENGVLESLSSDSQVYLRCEACGMEHRVDLIGVTSLDECTNHPCLSCGEAPLVIARHLMWFGVRCVDCGHESELAASIEIQTRCPNCGSARLEYGDQRVSPPFPERFADLRTVNLSWNASTDVHFWGESGIADAHQIRHESELIQMLPQAHKYRYVLIALAARLREARPDASDLDRWYLENITGNLCHDYVRQTGDVSVGAWALDAFRAMIKLAPDDLNRAVSEHSYAMAVFSLLARHPEPYVAAHVGQEDVRGPAIWAAVDAAKILEGYLEQHPEGEELQRQLARVRAVTGDLLRLAPRDDDERRIAIAHFSLAL